MSRESEHRSSDTRSESTRESTREVMRAESREKEGKVHFECSTQAAYCIKILIDTLSYYLNKKGCFVINSKGIYLRNTNVKEEVLCDLFLLAENFQEYQVYKQGEICFQINLNTFYNEMLKKIKKKDSITLRIIEKDAKLFLKIIKESPDNKGNQFSTKIPIIEARHVPIEPPKGYSQPINVISKTFQQSCREIAKPTNKEIEVTCLNERVLKFFANKDGVVENEAIFGQCRETIDKNNPVETFRSKCPSTHIVRPAKLAGLAETIKIFVKKDLPIYYKMNVGSLGEIGIYIKTIDQIRSEKDTTEDDENDDE